LIGDAHGMSPQLTRADHELLTAHRRWLHRRPELAFQEFATADFVAADLQRLGGPFERGLAGTGIVATLSRFRPATRNEPACAALAATCARGLFGAERVHTTPRPSMAGEDFAFLLERCPGAYLWLGLGEDHAPLHSSRYDFDDRVIADGARLLASLALAALNRD
jgi:metal-dependent amidase/aminoacylase/carboxypeptidase family protein